MMAYLWLIAKASQNYEDKAYDTAFRGQAANLKFLGLGFHRPHVARREFFREGKSHQAVHLLRGGLEEYPYVPNGWTAQESSLSKCHSSHSLACPHVHVGWRCEATHSTSTD